MQTYLPAPPLDVNAWLLAGLKNDCAACASRLLQMRLETGGGWLYIARRDDDGVIKVGFAHHEVRQRVESISRQTKRKHTVVHQVSCTNAHALEKHVHRHLRAFRVERNEWYRLPDAVLEALMSVSHLCTVAPPHRPAVEPVDDFDAYILRIDTAVAAAGGTVADPYGPICDVPPGRRTRKKSDPQWSDFVRAVQAFD